MPLLELCNVEAHYGGVRAVDGVSLTHDAGGILGIIGPNGAGKSTLLSVMSGAKRADGGTVRLEGEDVTRLSAARRCRRGICRTHQSPRPFKGLTVKENVEVAVTFGAPSCDRSVGEVLEVCGLAQSERDRVDDLAPSELRRLELARALATDPDVLLVDEVAAGMPTSEVEGLRATLGTIRDWGVALVVVEHVMELVMEVADRVVVLDHGRVIHQGSPAAVVDDPAVIEAYFGEPLDDAERGSG